MGEIKSALEIALEKTAHIEGDKSSADKRERKNDGKRLANEFLETGEAEKLSSTLAAFAAETLPLVHEGALSILLSAIKLPIEETDVEKTSRVGLALELLVPGQGIAALFGQVKQIFKQYLAEWEQTKLTVEQQFMPKLRAKQEEMARLYGQTVPMELNQDPEYGATLSRAKRNIDDKYETVIDEVRSRVRELTGIEE
ncbi:MAG TPA: hypothetical protein GXZ47_09740 [Treponema sp.]|nr:hypothetical protein [Treponema sp.]